MSEMETERARPAISAQTSISKVEGEKTQGRSTCDVRSKDAFKSALGTPAFAELFKANYHLIPLHSPEDRDKSGKYLGKAPIGSWRKQRPLTLDEAVTHQQRRGNVGVRLRETDLVIDADPRHYEMEDDPLDRLKRDFGIPECPTVYTGGGGFHLYLKKPEGFETWESLKDYPGVEFKSFGRQVVAPGSVHPETKEAYTWDPLLDEVDQTPKAPETILRALERVNIEQTIEAGSIEPEQLAEMLGSLEVVKYDEQSEWLTLMMACHHATSGEGREEFIEWSTSDPNYAGDAWIIGRRWDSLHADMKGKRVTERTLFKALIDAGVGQLIPRDRPEDDFPNDLGDSDVVENPKDSDFWTDWVWVAEAASFVRRSDGKKFTKEAWKSLYADRWPEGDLLNAIWKGKTGIRRLERLDFLPAGDEFIDGGNAYNLWRDSAVKAKVGDVSVFIEHMSFLFPLKQERDLVLDYLASLVQNPADKIHFALLIRGKQGTGKSWLGSLMRRIVGESNVVRPSNDEVTSKWTAWMEGSQLAIVEELMTLGRLELANRLKAPITENTLRIEQKGLPIYSVPNRLNFLCFTNHADALPLEHGDRRWMVVFSEAKRREDSYYESLFSYLDCDGPAFVKQWLLDRDVSLNIKGVAPSTIGKENMRDRSRGELESGLHELSESQQAPFDFDLVRLEDILVALPRALQGGKINARSRITRFLEEEVGAIQYSRYTKGGSGRRFYRLWSIRNHEKWLKMGAAGRIDAYMEHGESDEFVRPGRPTG